MPDAARFVSWSRRITRRSAITTKARGARRGCNCTMPSSRPRMARPEQLVAHERADLLAAPVLLRDRRVVLEVLVRPFERVRELVAFEDVVVASRLVAGAVLRVDRAADGPLRARKPLDPDHHPLRLSARVGTVCPHHR